MIMKNSGIEWIGDIPSNWMIMPIRAIFQEVTEKNKFGTEKIALKFTYGSIVRKNDFDADSDDYVANTIMNYTIVNPGTIIINGLNLNFDFVTQRVGLVRERGVITSAYLAFKPIDNNTITAEYATYLFKAYDGCKAFHNMGGGVRKILNFAELKRNYVVFPSVNQQNSISAFLDKKCAEIEALATDIQQQINDMEEYRDSVISLAVTQGIDSGAVMKNSDVDWCPSIPQHWVVTNPKALFSLRNQRASEGERQLTASQKLGIVYQDEFMEMENQKVVTVEKDFSILKHVEPNDFVISMRSFQGGLEYSELSGSISSAYVMLIPNDELVYPPFYRWFFKSSKYINAIQSTTNLVRDGQAMRYANFVKVPLFIIPVEEQKHICEYLDNKMKVIDQVISEKREQLEILEAYKRAIIYDYVTGKKEVPSA